MAASILFCCEHLGEDGNAGGGSRLHGDRFIWECADLIEKFSYPLFAASLALSLGDS